MDSIFWVVKRRLMSDINFDQIRALIASKAYDEARDKLIDVLYEDYDNLEAWLLLTECTHDQEEYKRAIREALRIAPSNPTARRLAMGLAQRAEPSGEGRQRHATNRAIQSLFNMIVLSTIIGIGVGIVFLLLDQPSADTQATPPPAVAFDQQCTASVTLTLQRLEGRCGLPTVGSLCIANTTVSLQSRDNTVVKPLAGDRAMIEPLTALETSNFDLATGNWGMALLNPSSQLQILMTSGVRLTEFSSRFDRFSFGSSPLPSECPALPPSGLLLIAHQSASTIIINSLPLTLDGIVFMQVDVAAGLRVFVLDGRVIIGDTTLVTNDAAQVPVTALLQAVADPIVTTENVLLRGDFEVLNDMVAVLNDAAILEVAAAPTPTITPSFTATAGIRVLSPTPTLSEPPVSATPRPTRTPTHTPVPTSTDIPISSDTTIPNTPQPTITSDPYAVAEPVRFEAQEWDCRLSINDVTVQYQIIFEPARTNTILATAILPQFNNTVVLLAGENYQSSEQLTEDWIRVPGYLDGEQWLLLREQEVIYSDDPDAYIADGIFRFVIQADGISGGIFSGNRFIGVVQQCLVQN